MRNATVSASRADRLYSVRTIVSGPMVVVGESEDPNASTRRTIAAARAGIGIVECEDVDDMFRKLKAK